MTISLTLGAENTIGANSDVHPFRFSDGTLCTWRSAGLSNWSSDGGGTWGTTPPGSRTNPGPIAGDFSEQAAIYCDGAGTIISLSGGCSGSVPGPYSTNYRKSTNDWVTVTPQAGSLTAPNAKPYVGDAGDSNPGYIFHHGLAFIPNGQLMGTFFGSNNGDVTPFDGYPSTGWPSGLTPIKSRQMMLYSSFPFGSVWSGATTVAYDQCFARGTQPDPHSWDVALAAPITQEGFNEADIQRLADGTYITAIRTGSRKGIATAPTPFTPIYGARSTDGLTWKLPRALMLDTATGIVSGSPNLAILGNNVLCMTFSTPSGYVTFSEDGGLTWSNTTELTNSENDLSLIQIDWNTVLVVYFSTAASTFVARQIVVDIVGHVTDPSIQAYATPVAVGSGRSALLQWFSNNTTGMTITGGPYSGFGISGKGALTTGNLAVSTTFTFSGNGGATQKQVTVPVV